MKDFTSFDFQALPVGTGKGDDPVLGNKALWNIGTVQGFHTRIVDLPSGGRMLVKTKNGNPEFTLISGPPTNEPLSAFLSGKTTLTAAMLDMYMSSGAFAFGAFGGINNADPMLTTEPITYKSTAVATREAVELTPLYDRDPPANGAVSKIYNHTVNPGGLNGPKQEMLARPPSEFSGLMRRCIQGRYGVGNTSNNMAGDEFEGAVAVGNTFGRTTGILRFGDVYFLVELSGVEGVVSCRGWRMQFPEEYTDIMAQGYSEEVETLCLAHGYVNPDEVFVIGSYPMPAGIPVAYGWNFSLYANSAGIVVRYNPGYSYDRNIWSKVVVEFAYGGTLSCALSVVEQKDGWMISGSSPIWVGSQWVNAYLSAPLPTSDQDFPVYFYHVGDEGKDVRWTWATTTNTFVQAEWDALVAEASWSSSFFGEGTCSFSVSERYGATTVHGFYIAGESSAQSSAPSKKTRTGQLSLAYSAMSPPNPTQPVGVTFSSSSIYPWYFGGMYYTDVMPYTYGESFDSDVDPKPGNHYRTYGAKGASGTRVEYNETSMEGHTSSLVVPSGDCACVYIGWRRVESVSSNQTTTQVGGAAYCEEWNWTWQSGVGYVLAGPWHAPVKRQFSCGRPSHLTGTGDPLVVNKTVESRYTQSITIHGPLSTVVGDVDSEIFHPNTYTSILSSPVTAISSAIHGDARYNTGALTASEIATTNEYPTDITLFVGAS